MPVLDRFSLAGKVALLTGGAGLYGRQLVSALAEAGADTWIASRNVTPLERIAEEHRARGLKVRALTLDQAEEPSVLEVRGRILKECGRVDILVNNAVSRPMIKGAYQADASTFAESMRVNATGLFIITRAFGDAMAERGSGAIVNIGSIHGMIAPDPTLYVGTHVSAWYPDYFFHKSGMINFTRFIASYYGARGVRCNCVSPGGFFNNQPEPFVKRYCERTFLGRMADDTDLQGAVVFLASDASSYVTGTNLPVDAGYTAK
jgi:NAD(P)-dependent dehydrogenase (short-subunit alcohol dehydrogenase family)